MYDRRYPVEDYVASSGDSSLTGEDLKDADLRHMDLSEKILFGTDLRGANLYGTKISLKCESFDGAKLDNTQVAKLLLMIQLADIDPKYQVGLRDLVRRVTGDKHFAALNKWMKLA